ncbi:hypothetical protein LMG7974_00054 [Campylobacter majalis]|uniref:C4-dicarboxylate ABC transporter n=1 Tax=Campylobacter majalis TaxID=2790656 RepID=A0ABN7K2F3_9BACT|nr:PilN domain-containing protein [Campylobacter majalis]CAD7286728.1 hypothetical protein LMG7974_00054 [Campylobacter majalis]
MKQTLNKNKNYTITIDVYNDFIAKYDTSEVDIFLLNKANLKKENFYISYLKHKDVQSATIEIPSSISSEDLENQITIKTYEELNLDTINEYKITYMQMPFSSHDSNYFNVYAIDFNALKSKFQTTITNIHFLDFIAYTPLLYQCAYSKNLLPNATSDVFINISKDDAFISIYKQGEHFISRPLRYDLEYIKDKYFELSGERLDNDSFYQMLNKIDIDNESLQSKQIKSVFKECFSYIYDVLNSLSRIYSLNITTAYIDIDTYNIQGLVDLCAKELEINASLLNISTHLNAKNFKLAQIHNLMQLKSIEYKQNQDDSFNFTIFKRPDPFLQRQSGKFIITIAGCALLSLLYPAYNYTYGYYLENQKEILNQEYKEKYAIEQNIRTKIATIENAQNEVKKSIKEQSDKLEFRKKLLNEIEYKKSGYIMKSKALYDISNMFNKNGVSMKSIKQDNNQITINAISQDEKRITDLIKQISANDKINVSTKKIYFNSDLRYESNITMELK